MLETTMPAVFPRFVTMHTVFSTLAGTSMGPMATCGSPVAASAGLLPSIGLAGDGALVALEEHPTTSAAATRRAHFDRCIIETSASTS
jgi:hypothetical protein